MACCASRCETCAQSGRMYSTRASKGGKAVATLANGAVVETAIPTAKLPKGDTFTLGVRPEFVRVAPGGAVKGKADVIERLGDRTLAYVRLSDGTSLVASDDGLSTIDTGHELALNVDGASAHLFDDNDVAYSAS